MPDLEATRQTLIGLWEKKERSDCAEAYPDHIEFLDRPRFSAKKGPGQRFICWDVGGYELVTTNRIRIQTAWDEFLEYEVSIYGDVLAFVDAQGCRFSYSRVKPGEPVR